MELEITIREASTGLKSVRATERKKNAEVLKVFLNGNAAPSLLTKNTVVNKGYTWNYLFDDVTEYILKETEKYETSKTFENTTVPLCSSLLQLCVAGANKGKCYMKCEKITESCIYIMKDYRLSKAIGDAYLNLLYKHVMPYEYYIGFITPSTWTDLLDVCINASVSSSFKTDSFTKLRLLLIVIKNASDNCQFTQSLLNALPKLEKHLNNVSSDKKIQDVVVEILIILLKSLSFEYRLSMCHFIESVLPPIIKCYDQNKDYKKKVLLFELLHLAVIVHHPLGRHRDKEGSLAHNWEVWNKYLNSISEIVCLEVSYLQKLRKQNDRLLHQFSYYYELSASVFYQIFKISAMADNNLDNTAKRFKINLNTNRSFNDLINELQQNPLPWLGIINSYVKKYGVAISSQDYLALLSCLHTLLTSNTVNVDWIIFEDLTSMALTKSYSLLSKNCDYNYIVLSIWNTCVRMSTSSTAVHKAVHAIIQTLLDNNNLTYTQAQTLIKMYLEKDVPVTQSSITTLIKVFEKFYSKCTLIDSRIDVLLWLKEVDLSTVKSAGYSELLLKIVTDENIVENKLRRNIQSEYDTLRYMLFDSIEHCILFTEFVEDVPQEIVPQNVINNNVESITQIDEKINAYFKDVLTKNNAKRDLKDIELNASINIITVILVYYNNLLQKKLKSNTDLIDMDVYYLLQAALAQMYSSFNNLLASSSANISSKIKALQLVKELLIHEFDPLLSNMVRESVESDVFHNINTILNSEEPSNDCDVIIDEDEDDINSNTLKHNCLLVLAAYCRREAEYREDILKLVLDDSIYNYPADMQCVFQCVEMLIDTTVEDSYIGLIFSLLRNMCQKLYRNVTASFGILKILNTIIDRIWAQDNTMKKNCLIMLQSYLQLSEQGHYPPKLVSLILECVAKTVVLDRKQSNQIEPLFEDASLKNIKGNVHNIRLFSSYLFKLVNQLSEDDMDKFSTELMNIFLIDVPEQRDLLIKDESTNRIFTVLHCYIALAQANKPMVQSIILQIIHLHHDKTLDLRVTNKVLGRLCAIAEIKDLPAYLNENILSVIEFWFGKNINLKKLPFSLFGLDDVYKFVDKHTKWLIAGDILWRKNGKIGDSDILKQIAKKRKQPVETIIEMCFPNIIALCLPYIVSKQFNLEYYDSRKRDVFRKLMQDAGTMFQLTGEILENDRWSNLFVENVGELLLLTVRNMSDAAEAEQMFHVKLLPRKRDYTYPKRIFIAILEYFDTLTDGSVIQYLCKNQAVAIFKILFELWRTVIEEKIFEWKVLALHSYVSFVTNLPLGFPSDAFMSNFTCNAFTQAIKICSSKAEMTVYIDGLKIILDFLLPHKGYLMRKSLLELLPVLTIKKELGFDEECAPILRYLICDMKDHLKESEDVMDFVSSMSQGAAENSRCYNLGIFVDKLKTHKMSLNCPSHETLMNIRQLLISNKHHIQTLYKALESKRFSEDCATSIIHQIVHSLCEITKSSNDDKTIIEAYNCLSEICSYDLKTLVTVPPISSNKLTAVEPRVYFGQAVVTTLLEVFFDKDVLVTNHVSETFNCFFKAVDIDSILDLDDIDKKILEPFLSSELTRYFITVDSFEFEQYVSKYDEGIFLHVFLSSDSDSDVWLRHVTSSLLQLIQSSNKFENHLRDVCGLKPQVCEKLLPPLIGLLLQESTETQIEVIGLQIKKFFSHIWEQTINDQIENNSDSNNCVKIETLTQSQKIIVQHMLDIVDFVRIQRNHFQNRVSNAVKTLNFLDLEYNKVAWAASLVDQNWAALYYGELWTVFQNKGISPHSPEGTANLSGGETLLRIFRKCYVSIGEADAIEGCGTAHLTIENEKRKHLINTGQFSDALLLHDIALSCGSQSDQDLHHGVVRSLHKSGMHHLALQYIKTVPENDQLDDVKYECLAFLGDWSDFVDVGELEEKCKQVNSYKSSHVKAFQYACLKNCLTVQITPEHEKKLSTYLDKAKLAVARLCKNLNLDNCKNIYKVLEKIHIFNDIEDYLSVRADRMRLSELLNKWEVDKLPQYNDFKHIEALSSQRVIILEQAAATRSESINEIVSLQIQYAKLAVNNNRVEMAQRLLAVAKRSKWSEDNNIELVESEVSWAKGHKEIALSLLRNIVNSDIDVKLAAVALRRYALWMAESKRDNPREIISKYLIKSVELLKNEQVAVRLKVYHDIAKFADAEYKQVVAYMNSSAFENRVKCMENMEGTATSLSRTSTRTKEENKALSANRRFMELDGAEIANTRMAKENFLHLAMRYYLLSLKQSDENHLSVFRVISLWLSNQHFEFQPTESERFEDLLHAIPSWKFVTVLPQLAPRLTDDDSDFNTNLKKILERCASEHPHHTLPILFVLKNSDKDNTILNASASKSQRPARAPEPRVLAATSLVTTLRNNYEHLRAIILDMDKMCDAIISFANYMPATKHKQQKIPSAECLHKLRNLTAIPVPTLTLPINADCKYNHITSLHSFESSFELPGGVNFPKKINCTDSSGKKHVLLIKGGDDLKQDAVMQQVFNIVNTLLENNPVTNRNKLLIRTYKVVPMSRLSGVLEWCEGTIPMGLYLVGQENKGAHARYRPQDISCDAARKKMINCSNSSHDEKLAVYNRVVRDFKPVFHYFFTEHYLEPVTWYERRLAYTKSVATSSMVGYILGLGDRHVYNILIDKRTAEVIHIDLGIAFEQGKTLRTPETIPFRLTRDVIAGFGASGTEGIFRRCCEKTMQLLRDNQETLLTILEVLLCDPLYSWSVKTAQQNAPDTSRNATTMCASGSASGLAARALLVVTSKLSGAEDGAPGGVAVAGHVARLLHAATDPFNLCRLFHGWQPYL